jgi:hypothetical protein
MRTHTYIFINNLDGILNFFPRQNYGSDSDDDLSSTVEAYGLMSLDADPFDVGSSPPNVVEFEHNFEAQPKVFLITLMHICTLGIFYS